MANDEERQQLLTLSQNPSASSCAHAGRRITCLNRLFSVVPARYGMVLAACLGFFHIFALRIDLSLAIVAMVKNQSSPNTTRHHLQLYDWTSEEQGWILSSFFYGYVLTQIPGGYLATKFGGRYVFGVPILIAAILTLFTPLAAANFGLLIALRFMEGLSEGLTFPAMYMLLGEWSPSKERTVMSVLVYSGIYFGTLITFPITAILCEYGFDGGWSSVFYVFGFSGVLWFILWLFLGFDSPRNHPWISEEERQYIETSITNDMVETTSINKIPWYNILTSQAIWAIIIAAFCFNWSFNIFITCIPSYFNDAFELSAGKGLIENGILSCIPYVFYMIVSLSSGVISDLLVRKGVAPILVRKMFESAGFLIGAVGFICLGYLQVNKASSVVLLTLSVALSGMIDVGHPVNILDIAPQYGGPIFGIVNMLGSLLGIVGPMVTKLMTHKPTTGGISGYRDEWKEVFIVSAEVQIFGTIAYLILGQGKRQWWAGGAPDSATAGSINRKTPVA